MAEEKAEKNIEIGGTSSLLGTAAVLHSREPQRRPSARKHLPMGPKAPQEGPTALMRAIEGPPIPHPDPPHHLGWQFYRGLPASALTSWGWQLYRGLPAFSGGVPGGLPSGAGVRPNLVPGGQ